MINRFKKHLKEIKIISVVVLAVVTLIIASDVLGFNWLDVFSYAGFYADKSEGLSVSFIDTGKSDAIFITCDGYNILVDAGEEITGKDVCAYLDRYKTKNIDLLVATHPDNDHIGGMGKVIDTYNVKELWQPKLNEKLITKTPSYENMIRAINEKSVLVKNPQKDYVADFGDLKVIVLSPDREYNNTNDSSIVLMLQYYSKRFLLMGDIETNAELNLINNYGEKLNADVLKVSHHGSNKGTSNELLQLVSPEYAVILVGVNINNLPSKGCIERLENNGCKILRTDLQATVTVNALKNGKILVHTEK